jgi:hypothetical protein
VGIPRPHTATPVIYLQGGERIQGEKDVARELATPFGCFLQIPVGAEDDSQPRGNRQVKRPTLLYRAKDIVGDVIELRPADELEIVAPLLTGPDPVVWQVLGSPEPLAAPRRLIGFQARLRRVED